MVQPGVNDLATTDPQIAAEWCYELNKDITPNQVHRNSKQYFWWKCPHGHMWKAKVYERTIENISCRKLIGKIVVKISRKVARKERLRIHSQQRLQSSIFARRKLTIGNEPKCQRKSTKKQNKADNNDNGMSMFHFLFPFPFCSIRIACTQRD